MGPGYFPLVLTLLLGGLGVAILLNGLRVSGEPVGAIPWRAILLIVLPVAFFGATLRGLGFVPSLAITVFASTLASREWSFGFALATTLLLVAACAGIFIFGLGLPISLFGPWVGGY
jgi:phosphate/sulfate permease